MAAKLKVRWFAKKRDAENYIAALQKGLIRTSSHMKSMKNPKTGKRGWAVPI